MAITRWRPGVVLALVSCALLLLAALAPDLFTGTGPDAADPASTLLPPGSGHWLGTDENGRDIYSRVVHGARPSLLIGLSASVLALAAGTVVGVVAAQGGRAADQVVVELLDVLMSIPGVLLVLLVVAVLGTGTGNLVAGLALVTLPGYARLVRAEVLRIRGAQFVEAATVLGWSRLQVVLRHIVPNAVGPLLALATVGVGGMIVTGSALSFLGLGPQPPTAEWGAMLMRQRRLRRRRLVDRGLPRCGDHRRRAGRLGARAVAAGPGRRAGGPMIGDPGTGTRPRRGSATGSRHADPRRRGAAAGGAARARRLLPRPPGDGQGGARAVAHRAGAARASPWSGSPVRARA